MPSTINTEGKTMSVVQIAHGGGGKLTEDLIKEVFVKLLIMRLSMEWKIPP